MTFEVGVVAHFSAQHHLVGDFGPASRPHSHAYRVDLAARGERLLADGTLFDITRLQTAVNDAIAKVDGQDLNELDEFAGLNPTAEVVAQFLFRSIAARLREPGLRSLQARVWESDDAYASYSGDLT